MTHSNALRRKSVIPELRLKARTAFTLLEMMLAVTIMLLVFGMAIPVFRSQLRAMDVHASRFDTQQNVRFAMATMDQQLRIAGVGVVDEQPLIVQATPFAVTFNADLATRDPAGDGDAFGAVYYDPDLPVGATMSMVPTTSVNLPLSSPTVAYPAISYRRSSGLLSAAETISFWVALDGSSGSNGRYALFRRVNAGPIDTLARGIVINAGEAPPFTYLVNSAIGVPTPIPPGSLPAYHVSIHGSPEDIGATPADPSLPDAIRSVRIHLVGTSVERDGTVSQRPADATIRLLNAGLLNHSTCGEAPIFGKPVTANQSPGKVTLSWAQATDESAGEKDVERYTVYKRDAASTDFGEPIASVAAGQSTYQFPDTQVIRYQKWVYGVAAVDCGSQPSTVSVTPTITIN